MTGARTAVDRNPTPLSLPAVAGPDDDPGASRCEAAPALRCDPADPDRAHARFPGVDLTWATHGGRAVLTVDLSFERIEVSRVPGRLRITAAVSLRELEGLLARERLRARSDDA